MSLMIIFAFNLIDLSNIQIMVEKTMVLEKTKAPKNSPKLRTIFLSFSNAMIPEMISGAPLANVINVMAAIESGI